MDVISDYVNGLVQDCSISIANTLEILHFALNHRCVLEWKIMTRSGHNFVHAMGKYGIKLDHYDEN